MVDQLPNLGRESEMLAVMGLDTIDQLFADIPEAIRRNEPLDLPPPQSEEEIWADAQHLLGTNVPLNSRPSFLGAGLYSNYVPTMVPMLATRGEFLTAYTPYQPEVSQGMLQAMWEFQTMISELTGLPVANVSMYDASTAAAEKPISENIWFWEKPDSDFLRGQRCGARFVDRESPSGPETPPGDSES